MDKEMVRGIIIAILIIVLGYGLAVVVRFLYELNRAVRAKKAFDRLVEAHRAHFDEVGLMMSDFSEFMNYPPHNMEWEKRWDDSL